MNNWLLEQASVITRSLGWALLHSLWQGLAIFAALRLLLLFMKNVDARIRYGISAIAMSSVFVWFVYDWIVCYEQLQAITIQAGTVVQTAYVNNASMVYPAGKYASTIQGLLIRMEAYIPVLVTLYAIGLFMMMMRFGINLIQLKRLRTQGLVVPDADLSQMLARLQENFSINKDVKLFLSTRIYTPMLTGVLKPMILLPVTTVTQLNAEQLEAILLHELAHIKRHDYLLNILQAVVETLLFFNPFVWLISASIRREREHCCDDIVVAQTPQALHYAQALAQLEASRQAGMSLSLAATGSNKNELFNRIKRIMEMKKENIHYGRVGIALMVTVALLLSIAWITPALAKSKKKNKAKTEQTVTSTETVTQRTERYVFVDSNGSRREYTSIDDVPQADRERLDDGDKTTVRKRVIVDNEYDLENDDMHSNVDAAGEEFGNAIATIVTTSLQQAGTAMKNIDWKQMNIDVAQAQKEIEGIDWKGIQKEIDDAMEEVNDPKLRQEIDAKVQSALAKSQKQLEKRSKTMNRMMVHANSPVPAVPPMSAKHPIPPMPAMPPLDVNSVSYEGMLKRMSEEGLINKSKGFNIEKQNGELYINGTKQPAEVYGKYNKYLNGKSVKINGNQTNLNINVNN